MLRGARRTPGGGARGTAELVTPPLRISIAQAGRQHRRSGTAIKPRTTRTRALRGPPGARQPAQHGGHHVKGFREFLTRGNLVDLAVAVVIGTAFTAIVTAIVKDVITPLIGAIWGSAASRT